jgi:hypothetical protein
MIKACATALRQLNTCDTACPDQNRGTSSNAETTLVAFNHYLKVLRRLENTPLQNKGPLGHVVAGPFVIEM